MIRHGANVLAATILASSLLGSTVSAADGVTDAQKAQLETLRAQVAGQIQLQAFDLLDELVYGWTEQPVFAQQTPVVLAGVSVPVGFGSGLSAMVENHFASLVTKNPRGNFLLTHCPMCTALLVHSGSKGTIVSRGVDQPAALAQAGGLTGARHALFLDFEAEGAALVLRARITSLEPALPIVYARTLSTSTSSAALLRTGDVLKSGEAARQEYLDALNGRGIFIFPIRIAIRTYAESTDSQAQVTPLPFLYLQIGAEAAFTQARAWTGSVSIAGTWTPEVHKGWMAQARINRLLTGQVSSLTRPDLYAFVGASIINIRGTGAQLFSPTTFNQDGTTIVTTQQVVLGAQRVPELENTFAAFGFGLELRVKNRIGVGVFLETLPALSDSRNIGRYFDLGFMGFQSFGAEVTFCF